MADYNDVSFTVVPADEECIVNAVQIGKRIKEPPHTVRSWADAFQEFLYIKKINGRWQYTEKSVSQFQIIKSLRRDKDMSIQQIKELISKNGFHNISSTTDVAAHDTFDIQYITTILTQENQRQMTAFMTTLIQQQNQFQHQLLETLKAETSIMVQDTIETSINEFQDTMCNILNKHENITEEVLSQLKYTNDKLDAQEQRDIDLVAHLRELSKDRIEQKHQPEPKKKWGFLNGFIHKKK